MIPETRTRRQRRHEIARMLRVNHAGELGAQHIYSGQLAVLGETKTAETLHHMKAQEEVHLAYFEHLLVAKKVRPTALHPLWQAAGFALGAGTALLGEKAAMACTIAVEEVIDEHYAAQIENLGDSPEEAQLAADIETFRQEEVEHREIGLDHGGEQTPGYALLRGVIRRGCKTAIWLSERL